MGNKRALLLRFVKTYDEGVKEEWAKVAGLCGGGRPVLPVPQKAVDWAREALPEFEILPFKEGVKGFVKLTKEIRERKFERVVLIYEGSKWGHGRLEAVALLSGARKIFSVLNGRVGKESKWALALRLSIKVMVAPLFSLLSSLTWAVWGLLLIVDLISLMGRGRKPKSWQLPPLNNKGVSVVIPSRNGRELLARNLPLLRKALEEWGGRWEVIVVDDASTDGTEKFLRQNFPWVKVARLERWRGFGLACNEGIRRARFEAILLLNNDVEVRGDFLSPLVTRLSQDPSLLAVGPGIVAWRHHLWHLSGKYEEVGWAPVVCGLFDLRKLRLLGGFDPLFAPFYWEEFDLSFRAWRRGWKCAMDWKVGVVHTFGTSIRRMRRWFVQKTILRNKLLFAWKNLTHWRWLFLHFLLLPWRFSQDALTFGCPCWTAGLLEALFKLPSVLLARWRERREELVGIHGIGCLQPSLKSIL